MLTRNIIMFVLGLILIDLNIGYATLPSVSSVAEYTERQCIIEGNYPKVGEVFTVKYRVRLKGKATLNANYYVSMSARSYDPVDIIDNQETVIEGLSHDVWRELQFRARITEPALTIALTVNIRLEGTRDRAALSGVDLVLIDPSTGQYGDKEEYSDQLFKGAEWHYDPAGEFVNFPDHVSPECAKKNLEIIERIQEINSDLSDWEAIYLHYDGIKAIMAGIGTTGTTEEDIWCFFLDEGWLAKYRSGESIRQQWLNNLIDKYKGKPLVKEGGMSSQFFRNSNSSIGDNYPSCDSGQVGDDDWPYIYFKGQFRYLKHKYNPTSGLIDSTTDNPIKNAVIRVRSYWSGSQGNRWSFRIATDDNGDFFATLSWQVPQNIWIKAHPLVYFWGPSQTNKKVKVSDPTPTSYLTWRDDLDTTIFLLPRVEGGVDSFFTSTDTFDFGVMYIDSFVSGTNDQPKSGAANIHQNFIHARSFTSPPPDTVLRVLWEPGYDSMTLFRNDTIWVQGEPGGTILNTDEWDDDLLLHEYGHYLMKYYAKLKPTTTSPHKYWKAYPDDKYLAYKEGWAHYASGWLRTGYTHDSLIIDNKRGIGSGQVAFLNLENPWNCTGITPDSFDGGPWCEGAVAGVIWDIYDSHNEIPYPYYPDSSNGFVDITNDYLSMGYNEIWNIFKNYDPPGSADTHVVAIQHFKAGWIAYNYGYPDSLTEIFYHHYIGFTPPSAPVGLSGSLEEDENSDTPKNIRLYWNQNSEADLQGYRIYRQSFPGFGWANIGENDAPDDTTYLDETTSYGMTYEYKVTAYDSLGNESAYSDTIQISTPNAEFMEDHPRLNCNIIRDIRNMQFSLPTTICNITVKIYDCCGRIVLQNKIDKEHIAISELRLTVPVNLRLASGVYFIDIESEDGNKYIEKFVIVR